MGFYTIYERIPFKEGMICFKQINLALKQKGASKDVLANI